MTETVSLVVLPVALIRVPVWAPKLTLAISLIIEPFSLVLGLVGPVLHTIGALFALLAHIARVKSVLHHFNVFNIL